MPARSPRPAADDAWRDAQGTPISLRARVEQITSNPPPHLLRVLTTPGRP